MQPKKVQTMMSTVFEMFRALVLWYRAMYIVLFCGNKYDDLRVLLSAPRTSFWSKYRNEPRMSTIEEATLGQAVWLHTIGLSLELWNKPHYRAKSLGDDIVDNFSNIALPGTVLPFSLVCRFKWLAVLYLLTAHPFLVLAASCVIVRSEVHRRERSFAQTFEEELLAPKHWFALWRINSTLVAAHHYEHSDSPSVQAEYNNENKWDFLHNSFVLPAESRGFNVTPVMKVPEILCKHKNIEGGMGIHLFKNAVYGGDWIIQERLYNCAELRALLPENAPLSTFRVITMADPTAESADNRYVPMTFVWRAGRAGKPTDHSSVLLAIDPNTLRIKAGMDNSNWYKVGRVVGSHADLLTKQSSQHPDTQMDLQGKELKCGKPAIDACLEAHKRLMPHVPAVGWDVAVTDELGAVLLEANISCNFFGGEYDRQHYLTVVDTYFANKCRSGPRRSGPRRAGSESPRSSEDTPGLTEEPVSGEQ